MKGMRGWKAIRNRAGGETEQTWLQEDLGGLQTGSGSVNGRAKWRELRRAPQLPSKPRCGGGHPCLLTHSSSLLLHQWPSPRGDNCLKKLTSPGLEVLGTAQCGERPEGGIRGSCPLPAPAPRPKDSSLGTFNRSKNIV